MIVDHKLQKLLQGTDVEAGFGVVFGSKTNINTYCPFHGEDPLVSTTPSCSVSSIGLFNCKAAGCGESGDVFKFYSRVHGCTRQEAISILRSSGKRKTPRKMRPLAPTHATVCQNMLAGRSDFLQYLLNERGLTKETLLKYEIGCDEHRITIPIRDAEGNLINVRRYLPHAITLPKMLSYSEGYGAPALYPLDHFLNDTSASNQVVLCEGEWDCLVLRQLGFSAVTVAGSVAAWRQDFNNYFRGKKVAICFDVNDKEDDAGQREAVKRANILHRIAAEVKVVKLPLPPAYTGGDITDYFIKEKHTAIEFLELIDSTAVYAPPPMEDLDASLTEIANSPPRDVTLHDATLAANFYSKIRVKALVAGKATAPFMPPQLVVARINERDGTTTVISHEFNVWDSALLTLIRCSETKLKAQLRTLMGIPSDAYAEIDVQSTLNVEELYLIPSIDFTDDQGSYVLRRCYYIGHGLQTNKVYHFIGYTIPDPQTQEATHVFVEAKPTETDLDSYRMSAEYHARLRKTFSIKEDDESVDDKMSDIANQLSQHVTRIYGRPDLHMALDLVYHSPLSFVLDGERVHKGWLEALIIGDTRTGKGRVAEGLQKYYGAGELVSGENVSVAGLVGGVQHMGDKWTLVWGRIPLSDRRLVIIDEVSALSYSDIGRMSRVRSEGVAEITKIVSEKTTARTRLVWIGNPRTDPSVPTRRLNDYNYGIEAVPELVGNTEDVARFDFALTIAHDEVADTLINRTHTPDQPLQYPPDLCRELLIWIWSRTADDIVFLKGVTEYIMASAFKLGRVFAAKIALVQSADIRFKIARIACAVAARTYSSPDGIQLVIGKEHVDFAYNYLYSIYSKPSAGYLQLSQVERDRAELRDKEGVFKALQIADQAIRDLIDGLLEHRQLHIRDLCDFAGIDLYQARTLVSELVRLRALTKEYTYYVKRPAFKDYLRALKMRLWPDPTELGSTQFTEEET